MDFSSGAAGGPSFHCPSEVSTTFSPWNTWLGLVLHFPSFGFGFTHSRLNRNQNYVTRFLDPITSRGHIQPHCRKNAMRVCGNRVGLWVGTGKRARACPGVNTCVMYYRKCMGVSMVKGREH